MNFLILLNSLSKLLKPYVIDLFTWNCIKIPKKIPLNQIEIKGFLVFSCFFTSGFLLMATLYIYYISEGQYLKTLFCHNMGTDETFKGVIANEVQKPIETTLPMKCGSPNWKGLCITPPHVIASDWKERGDPEEGCVLRLFKSRKVNKPSYPSFVIRPSGVLIPSIYFLSRLPHRLWLFAMTDAVLMLQKCRLMQRFL